MLIIIKNTSLTWVSVIQSQYLDDFLALQGALIISPAHRAAKLSIPVVQNAEIKSLEL